MKRFRWFAPALVMTFVTGCGGSSTPMEALDGPVMRYPARQSDPGGSDAQIRGRLELNGD
jgi:hypothetical protein